MVRMHRAMPYSGWLDIFLRYLAIGLALLVTLSWVGGQSPWVAAWMAVWLTAASRWWRKAWRPAWHHPLRASMATALGSALLIALLAGVGQVPLGGWSVADSAVAVTLVEFVLTRYPVAAWLAALAVHQHRIP
jgi:hypothetical protein